MLRIGVLGLVVVAVLLAGMVIAAVVVFARMGRRKVGLDPDAGLAEDLAGYPPAPAAGTHRLLFEGRPVRLRLVVLAPAGRNVNLNADMAEGVLQAILHGLGEVADLDRPRVRVWPGQLSQEGFAPKFFENVERPERSGEPSNWTLVAGPARAGQKTVLLGLALHSRETTARGNVRLSEEQWPDKLRVQIVG